MPYNKFSQFGAEDEWEDRSEIDTRIMTSDPHLLETYDEVISAMEKLQVEYLAAGETLGVDYKDVKVAWELLIEDIAEKMCGLMT